VSAVPLEGDRVEGEPRDPAHAVAESSGPVKVLYVGGLGRSGSTLLDIMLGQLPGFFSAGEVRYLWQLGVGENRACGCGVPFRECPFWTRVGLAAFGGWDRVDAERIEALARAVDRHARWPLLVRPGIWPPFRRRLEEYAEKLSRVFEAVHAVGETRVIIDSSKAPSTAFVLRTVPGLDLRVAHLIRDSRGVAYSWSTRVRRPDTPHREVYMHRFHPLRTGSRWITRNLLMEVLAGLGVQTVRVQYERVVARPREEIGRILDTLGERVPQDDLAFIGEGEVFLRGNHTVMGNPLRMRSGPLKLELDLRWRTSMPAANRTAVTVLTWPMLKRYGYDA
jgi:hypothetical protein